ncbi:MAG: hypothetical protein EOP54_02245 [Sphingobacteriales bacterium]|nr:MAG: hypothetical protein EOP54_02245 [Sphingobacteriales bacterium]
MTPTTCFTIRKALPAKVLKVLLYLSLFVSCCFPAKEVIARQEKQTVVALKVNKRYKGKSIKVDDGDTFTFLNSRKSTYRIRLEGIDAPEKGMPYAKKSKEFLAALLLDQTIELHVVAVDHYGRYVCRVYCNEEDVNRRMVQAGYAWHYNQYNRDPLLSQAEANARARQTGLWQNKNPLAPWTVRAYRRAGYSDARFSELRKQNSPEIRKFLQAI